MLLYWQLIQFLLKIKFLFIPASLSPSSKSISYNVHSLLKALIVPGYFLIEFLKDEKTLRP
jgi:hypothetical protein